MKTELQIAKENVRLYQEYKKISASKGVEIRKSFMKKHKETCERWFEFLVEDLRYMQITTEHHFTMKRKAEDLQEAIKLYKENGI